MKRFLSRIKIFLTDPNLAFSYLSNRFRFLFIHSDTLIISLTEHLGDLVAAEPVARFVNENNPGKKILWVVNRKYKGLVKSWPSVDQSMTVTCLTEWIFLKKKTGKKKTFDLHISGKICSKHGIKLINPNKENIAVENYFTKGNLLWCFSRTAGLEMDERIAPRLYWPSLQSASGLPANIILIHSSAILTEKEWLPENWNKLILDLTENYKPGKIIEIGDRSCITIDHPLLERRTGMLPLQKLAELIEQSSVFIGIESGPAHIANALKKQSIILAGTLPNFKIYMPYSGYFQEHQADTIIFFDKPLSAISYEEAKPFIENLLKKKLNPAR